MVNRTKEFDYKNNAVNEVENTSEQANFGDITQEQKEKLTGIMFKLGLPITLGLVAINFLAQ